MAKSKKKAEVVFLVCKETGDYNYTLRRKPGGEKLSIQKYCPRLRKHTEHTRRRSSYRCAAVVELCSPYSVLMLVPYSVFRTMRVPSTKSGVENRYTRAWTDG